jgi:hypothetical protein
MKGFMRLLIPPAMVLALVLTAACQKSSNTSTTATTPTAPTPTVPLTTETFSGTVPVASSDFHSFTVAQKGEVDITLTSAGPPSTIIMVLAVGTVSNSTCTPTPGATVNTAAGTWPPQLAGSSVAAGTLCVQVSDVGDGTQTSPVTYTVAVVHP